MSDVESDPRENASSPGSPGDSDRFSVMDLALRGGLEAALDLRKAQARGLGRAELPQGREPPPEVGAEAAPSQGLGPVRFLPAGRPETRTSRPWRRSAPSSRSASACSPRTLTPSWIRERSE